MFKIIDYYYDDDVRTMFINFSTFKDGDNFYRTLQLDYKSLEYYSPNLFVEEDLYDVDEDFIVELIDEYQKENDLPEALSF